MTNFNPMTLGIVNIDLYKGEKQSELLEKVMKVTLDSYFGDDKLAMICALETARRQALVSEAMEDKAEKSMDDMRIGESIMDAKFYMAVKDLAQEVRGEIAGKMGYQDFSEWEKKYTYNPSLFDCFTGQQSKQE